MKFLKILYITALVIVVSLIFNITVDRSKQKTNSYVDSEIINTSANNNVNQFQDLKKFQNPDFTIAAEKTINSVVHVKNTALKNSSNSLIPYSKTVSNSLILYSKTALTLKFPIQKQL